MTHDQYIASDPAISAWVSASAGTGKTKVLTDRVLRLLLAGASPSGILCITYTKAAAAEMESRISAELSAWVMAGDEALKASLSGLTGAAPDAKTLRRARQLFALVLDAPQRMRIQTIHSFCQSVLVRFPLEADVPPHFTAADEITSRELLAQARSQLFASAGRAEYQAFGDAVTALASLVGDQAMNELLAEIVQRRRRFSEWFESAPAGDAIHAALDVTSGMNEKALLEKHLSHTPEEEKQLRQVCAALAESKAATDIQMQLYLSEWLEKRSDVESYISAFITDKGTPRKQLFTKAAAKPWPQIAEMLAREQQRVFAFFEERQSQQVAQVSHHVVILAQALLDSYQKLKERHGYLDYDDQILFTARLLTRPGVAPWVLYKLDGGIDHLLIDEAQDTSPEQWRIVNALASEFFAGEDARSIKRTLFVVGDEKQSIFSFQGAAPSTFDAMQRGLSKLVTRGGADFRRVRLALSFRSSAPVLVAVDSVFAQEAARDGLIFTEADIRHEVHRKGMAGRVELWPLLEAPDEESFPAWHIPDAHSRTLRPDVRLAQHIASTIAGWLKERRMLASQGRAVTPGDIMILVQRRGTFADAMLRALKRLGIAVAGADRLVLTGHIAVADCLSLARFLLLPQDDLSLAEVLKSPFIGISEEALFELAYNRGEETLWQRLKDSPAHASASWFLSSLLAATDYMPPYELFAHVLETCGGRMKLAGRLGGEIDDPINEFLALAIEYGKAHAPSLQGFVHWLETGATEIKRDMEKGRDEVRILTVHGAKGLQAPIIYLPDTTRMPPHEGGILWTEGANPVPLWTPAAEFADRHYRALKDLRRLETEREHRRLLYVAMTRAEDELYIGGWKGGRAVDEACWYELVRRAAENWEIEGEKRVLHAQQSTAVRPRSKTAPPPLASDMPGWARQAPAEEPNPPRPLTPSHMGRVAGALPPFAHEARERGLLVHRLLQYLPDAAAGERPEALARFLARYGTAFSPQERERIGREVMAILDHPEFAAVFGPDSGAEVSIAGIAGKDKTLVIAGRMDRLAVLPHDVYIIDYKTDRKAPADASAVPDAYLRQMDGYRQLVKEVYPGKTVHCALLWTTEPTLMLLPENLLEALAA